MSRTADVVQVPSPDRRISHRLQHIPCSRCCTVIEYDRGTRWSVISKFVNQHWEACPAKPHAWSIRMASTPITPPDTTIGLPPPVASKQRTSSAAESAAPSSHTWIVPGCERKRRNLEQRKLELEQDEYAKNVTVNSVFCGGCEKTISLDKRSMYYPGLWLKHRRKCQGIDRIERAKGKVPQALNDAGQVGHTAVSDGSPRQEVVQLDHAGHNNEPVTRALSLRHYDSEMSTSEEEEEEGEMLSHEPFPTLNSDFYQAERYYNRSGEWTYRYATKDEISMNLFHGQDEPYARPVDGQPFMLQSETLRCIMNRQATTS